MNLANQNYVSEERKKCQHSKNERSSEEVNQYTKGRLLNENRCITIIRNEITSDRASIAHSISSDNEYAAMQ